MKILSREVSDVEPRGVLQQRMSCLLLSSRARGCQAPLGSHPQVLIPHFIVVIVVIIVVVILNVVVVVAGSRKYPGQIEGVPVVRGAPSDAI